MSLSPPVQREPFHHRTYDFRGYRREDGLWDIEGRIIDTKAYAFNNAFRGVVEAGMPLHDMSVRLTIDEDLVVQDIEAVTEASPFRPCVEIPANYKRMIGVRLGKGWRQDIRSRLGGTEGCTHISEMLTAMGTVAMQTMYPVLIEKAKKNPRPGPPALLNTCHAFRADGDVAKQFWPDYYEGE